MLHPIEVQFRKLDDRAVEPRNAHGTDAGWDLFILEDTLVRPWTPDKPVRDVHSGIAINVPEGWYARLIGRSSSLRKKKMQVIEGIIDAGFQGELLTTVASASDKDVWLEAGTSICQIILTTVQPVTWIKVSEFLPSARGESGFGSSGA